VRRTIPNGTRHRGSRSGKRLKKTDGTTGGD
jgi:hypothetical protein